MLRPSRHPQRRRAHSLTVVGGGPGAIDAYNGLFVVSQTAEVHTQVEHLFDMLRQAIELDGGKSAQRESFEHFRTRASNIHRHGESHGTITLSFADPLYVEYAAALANLTKTVG